MNCEQCNGVGWYQVPNHQHDVIENVECIECLNEQRIKANLEQNLTKLLMGASQETLAQIVATLTIKGVSNNPNDSLDRIESIIQTKNTLEAVQIASFMANIEHRFTKQ